MARFSLVPKDREFFNLFDEAGTNILHASDLLSQLMRSWPDAGGLGREILICEQEGDRITHDIIHRLNTTSVTPIDREDIYALASCIDDVLDFVEATADQMVVFKIEKPTPEAVQLADIIYRASDELGRGIAQLGKVTDLSATFVLVNSLENEADRMTRDAIARLFENERDAISVHKWKEIYESLEETTDRCEDVANVLERILLKHV